PPNSTAPTHPAKPSPNYSPTQASPTNASTPPQSPSPTPEKPQTIQATGPLDSPKIQAQKKIRVKPVIRKKLAKPVPKTLGHQSLSPSKNSIPRRFPKSSSRARES